jgi:hypothetical protein
MEHQTRQRSWDKRGNDMFEKRKRQRSCFRAPDTEQQQPGDFLKRSILESGSL